MPAAVGDPHDRVPQCPRITQGNNDLRLGKDPLDGTQFNQVVVALTKWDQSDQLQKLVALAADPKAHP